MRTSTIVAGSGRRREPRSRKMMKVEMRDLKSPDVRGSGLARV
jgi:hypothetical protein